MTDKTQDAPQAGTPDAWGPDLFWQQAQAQAELLGKLGQLHGQALTKSLTEHAHRTGDALRDLAAGANPLQLYSDWQDYMTDSRQRSVLFLDTLRQRGDNAARRAAEGLQPVLIFDYEMVVDGRELPRPVNYSLVRILPPEGTRDTRQDGRPWVIIDPRAGHGSGIGGFKAESEVGVALDDGHPVYFVIFFPDPMPGQTIADVTAAEAQFLRKVGALHPDSPKPLITGNCQGGWAAMILAATQPDLSGPVVIAGAPLSYWAGQVGQNPFRYYGGLAGGAVPALLSSDLGGGTFDGASLVQNFENLNPARNIWRKNYDLYAGVDDGADRFLDFERWWSGFYFMTGDEIRWIVENLFVGNKLTAGQAVLNDGTPVDLTRITSPVVVFASHGDNITPPQQALHWIADLYASVEELRARGHVIVYTLHDSVGHLGIFVSAKVARTQHKQITSVVKTIETLAPGLYEMIINEVDGDYEVDFQTRSIDDIRTMGDGPEIAEEFAAVSQLSDWAVKTYELTARPFIQAAVTPEMAAMTRKLHPMRMQMTAFSSENPGVAQISGQADAVRADRSPAAPDNTFRQAESVLADVIERNLDLYRDTRDALLELSFHALYAAPWARALASKPAQPAQPKDIRAYPEVRAALSHLEEGGYAEAIIRMMILLARARGAVRRDRLERANAILQSRAPFDTMDDQHRTHLIHEQGLIVDLAGREAISTLPALLPGRADRARALDLLLDVAGPAADMDAPTIAMFEKLQSVLGMQATGWTQAPELPQVAE